MLPPRLGFRNPKHATAPIPSRGPKSALPPQGTPHPWPTPRCCFRGLTTACRAVAQSVKAEPIRFNCQRTTSRLAIALAPAGCAESGRKPGRRIIAASPLLSSPSRILLRLSRNNCTISWFEMLGVGLVICRGSVFLCFNQRADRCIIKMMNNTEPGIHN